MDKVLFSDHITALGVGLVLSIALVGAFTAGQVNEEVLFRNVYMN